MSMFPTEVVHRFRSDGVSLGQIQSGSHAMFDCHEVF